MWPLCDGKAEPGAVADTGRDGDLDGMPHELEPAAAASHAGFRPRLASPTAVGAHALHRDAERERDALRGFGAGQLHRGAKRVRTLVGKERASDTFDGRRHRREIDGHFVCEAVDVMT